MASITLSCFITKTTKALFTVTLMMILKHRKIRKWVGFGAEKSHSGRKRQLSTIPNLRRLTMTRSYKTSGLHIERYGMSHFITQCAPSVEHILFNIVCQRD